MSKIDRDPMDAPAGADSTERRRLFACLLLLIVAAGYVAWGAMAALWPNYLLGPGGKPILAAGYEGFTRASWSALASTAPATARYMGVLFRTYGAYNVVFGIMAGAIVLTAFRRGERWAWWALLAGNSLALVSAMIYDRSVNAIGPFEMSEYLGLAMVWTALVLTAPFFASRPRAGALPHLRPRGGEPAPRPVGGR